MTSGRRSQALSRYLIRFVLFGTLAVLCALAVADGAIFLAGLLGIGAIFTARRLLDRQGNRRRELWRWGRENARELSRVAREDRIAALQMKRLEGLQAGLLESWDLLPEGYRPLLDEDVFTIVGEVEGAARLARRRAALRRHLDSVDRADMQWSPPTVDGEVGEVLRGAHSRASSPLGYEHEYPG